MNSRDSSKKSVKRLALRREVVRVLANDALSKVHGGIGGSLNCPFQSQCNPSFAP